MLRWPVRSGVGHQTNHSATVRERLMSSAPEETSAEKSPRPSPAPTPAPTPSAVHGPRPANRSTSVPPPAPASSFGSVSADGAVFLRLPDGNEHQVGQWATGDPAQAMDFFTRKYADLISEIDLAAKRLTDDRATPAQAEATATKIREALIKPSFVGDLSALIARIGQLEVLINAKRDAVAASKVAAKEEALAQREAMVEEAESLAQSKAWKVTTERFLAMIEEWKSIPRGDRAKETELWKRLSAARTTFDKRRRAHYAELEQTRDAAKAAKEKLVAQAEALSVSRDWAKTTTAYRGLLEQWKKSGRAGRSDDALWQQFRGAQDKFFAARNGVFAERDGEEKAALAAKQALLAEAEKLVPVKDPRATKKALRQIQERWEKAGRVPRNDIKRIEAQLKRVEDAVRDAESNKWQAANPELLGRATDTVNTFREKVTKLEKQLAAAQDSGNRTAIDKAQQAVDGAKSLLAAAEQGLAKFGG